MRFYLSQVMVTAPCIVVAICFIAAPAYAHHIICTPHFVTDSEYPEPILTLAENVGQWRIELIQSPGNPAPEQPVEIRFQLSSLNSENELSQPISVRVERQQAFGSSVDIYGPKIISPQDNAYSLSMKYPQVGNYLVLLTLTEGEIPTGLVLPIVVGQPGRPFVTLACFIISIGILMLVVRAIKVKQCRLEASSA